MNGYNFANAHILHNRVIVIWMWLWAFRIRTERHSLELFHQLFAFRTNWLQNSVKAPSWENAQWISHRRVQWNGGFDFIFQVKPGKSWYLVWITNSRVVLLASQCNISTMKVANNLHKLKVLEQLNWNVVRLKLCSCAYLINDYHKGIYCSLT